MNNQHDQRNGGYEDLPPELIEIAAMTAVEGVRNHCLQHIFSVINARWTMTVAKIEGTADTEVKKFSGQIETFGENIISMMLDAAILQIQAYDDRLRGNKKTYTLSDLALYSASLIRSVSEFAVGYLNGDVDLENDAKQELPAPMLKLMEIA